MPFEFPQLNKQSGPDSKGWIKGCCPLHDDKNPSFMYHPDTGGWTCLAGCGEGGWKQFLELYDPSALERMESKKKSTKKKKAKKALPDKGPAPPIKESTVKEFQEHLNENLREKIFNKRGITSTTMDYFEMGWDVKSKRWTIPIRDEKNTIGNIRMYNGKKDRFKMMPFKQKDDAGAAHLYGAPVRLFGLDKLIKYKEEEVIICEGELDRMLLHQNGFFAVTGTGGVKSFKKEWIKHFKGKRVVLLLDCDGVGQTEAVGRYLPLFESADIISIKNVLLPLAGTKEDNDITDYFLAQQMTAEDLRVLIDEAPVHVYAREVEGEADPIIILDSFIQIEQDEFVDKRVQCDVVVSGEISGAYHSVERFKVSYCKALDDGDCVACLQSITIPRQAEVYIGSCLSTDSQVIGMLRQYCCKFNKKPTIEIEVKRTIKEFFCHQKVTREKTGKGQQELLEKKCYYISPNDLPPGSYRATGYVKTHPKSQAVTMLIEEMIPQEDDYQSFKLEKEIGHLEAYREMSLREIIRDLTNNVTNIYERDELLTAVLLTFFSPLWVQFNTRPIRGWILSIIIGDSGLGKTQTYSRISDYIGAGDFFSCLTGSRTGLAYAMVDNPTRGWQVKIGRYPANSGKLLLVDEVQHLEVEDLQSISKAMDEGFMQIDKVKSRGYDSMTRLMMLCNPKYDRVMDECMYGCETLKTVFPPTLLRRVDFAIFANAGDMTDYSIMNKKAVSNSKISPEMLRAAIFWVWNLKIDQIFFDPEAEAACLHEAQVLSNIFGSAVDIPLVAPSDFRFNLARISTAFACILMSTSDFKTLTVMPEHVETAKNFILKIYKHQSCGLDEYSEIVKLKTQLVDYDRVEAAFLKKKENAKHGGEHSFVKIIYHFRINPSLRADDLMAYVGCGKDAVKDAIKVLKSFHLIRAGKDGYRKQPKFVKFLRKFVRQHLDYFDCVDFDDDDLDDDIPDYLK